MSLQQHSGNLRAAVEVDIPLAIEQLDLDDSSVSVTADVATASLSMPTLDLTFSDLVGSVTYSLSEGLVSDRVAGKIWGQPVSASISTIAHAQDPKAGTRVAITGSADIEDVYGWLKDPLLGFASGTGQFSVAVDLLRNARATVSIDSDLAGVLIDAPEPLGKQADELQPISLKYLVEGERQQLLVDTLPLVRAELEWQQGQAANGWVHIDDPGYQPPASEQGIRISGRVTEAQLEEWIAAGLLYNDLRLQDSVTADARVEGLRIGHLHGAGVKLVAPELSVYLEDDSIRMEIDDDELRGSLVIPDDPAATYQIDIEHTEYGSEHQEDSDISTNSCTYRIQGAGTQQQAKE